ncbi:hypothetical protein [Noviherbaspirillum saxi]|uniref:Helix-turn-helix domain-containing protein n=1 Tax=Noviherbaspirillum saxi TaxID=2320863 RepID=A0A3A3FSA4_9BURK|nr:hypothetical protein [Noviherbaspirillum saxi]RJF99042.1 hypothetical protein D3871_11360 [Noviherbaspirillum saxi]
MKTAVRDTSIAAWHAIPCDKLKTQNDRIEAIVAASDGDMSLGEIKVVYRGMFQRDIPEDKRIEANTVSRAVNQLITAGRLRRRGTVRPCKFSGVDIHPVFKPPLQNSLDISVE